jgi:hypothetical protein
MARPLSSNSTAPRNGSHSGASSLTADLALAPTGDDTLTQDLPVWEEERAAPATDPLSRENATLRAQLAETERLLADLRKEAEQALNDQQTECERLLEEKSELIRDLHRKVQGFQERPSVAPADVPREEELMALGEELERERRQLQEDEAALMEQMGQMEVQMSRERAELARQRSELHRLQNEIRHELELAARDTALRERLAPLQRRHQELNTSRAAAPAEPLPQREAAPAAAAPQGSGLLRRWFRK